MWGSSTQQGLLQVRPCGQAQALSGLHLPPPASSQVLIPDKHRAPEPSFSVCFLRTLPVAAGTGMVQESGWLEGARSCVTPLSAAKGALITEVGEAQAGPSTGGFQLLNLALW